MFELTDAEYVVTGSYYQKGDSIQVSSRLESTTTGDNIYDFPIIWGLHSQKEQLITEIREQLKGYWAIKEANKLSTINPPKYEAYQQFLKCSLFDINCHQSVIAIDSTFLLARIYLSYATISSSSDSLYRIMSRYVERNLDKCSDFEKNFFEFVKHRKTGNNTAALAAINKNLELDPRDLDIAHYSAYSYLMLNQPEKAAAQLAPFFDEYEVFKDQIRDQSYGAYFFMLNRAGMDKKLLSLVQNNSFPEWVHNYIEVPKALMINGNMPELRNLVDSIGPEKSLRLVHMFNAIFPPDSINIFEPALRANLDRFSDPRPGWNYMIWSFAHLYNWDSKAFAYYQLREWEKAEKILLKLRNVDWKQMAGNSIPATFLPDLNWHMNTWREGLLGATYARQEKTEEAHVQIKKLESFRPSFPGSLHRMGKGGVSYCQGRIHAVLGENERAVTRLAQSIEEGRVIEFDNFVYDWDLTGLKGYEPYEDLVRPR